MEITQATGMKMPKSWPKRSKIPVCGMQTIANLNQCGIDGRARLPKSRKEKTPAGGERSERKIKVSCPCRAEKAESEEDHTVWSCAARCDGKVCTPRRQSQRAAMAKVVHYDGKDSALRWQRQRTAMAKTARCDGKDSTLTFLGQ